MEKHNKLMNVSINEINFFLKDYLDYIVNFECYSENELTYSLSTGYSDYGNYDFEGYEIGVISESLFLRDESLSDLLNKKNISFIGIRQFKKGVAISKYVIYKPILSGVDG